MAWTQQPWNVEDIWNLNRTFAHILQIPHGADSDFSNESVVAQLSSVEWHQCKSNGNENLFPYPNQNLCPEHMKSRSEFCSWSPSIVHNSDAMNMSLIWHAQESSASLKAFWFIHIAKSQEIQFPKKTMIPDTVQIVMCKYTLISHLCYMHQSFICI